MLAGVLPGPYDVLARVEQRLARDAADVEAGAAERGALFHERDLEPELRRAKSADITARAGADDNEVEGIHEENLT
jgi:hypothetical protein